MPYTIKPGSFKYKKSNGQFFEIDCFEGPDLTEEVAALEKGKAPIIIDSATGNPIVIKDGADSLPVEGMKIHFSPVQSGTGDPSPSNIRPISGFDVINVFRTGVNIWDEELELGGINSSTGIPYTSTSALRAKNYIPVVPGAKYYFKSSSTSVTRCWYDKDKNYISTGYIVNTEITAPDNAYFFRFDIPSSYGTTYNHDISLNYPSTDTEYHPYTGQLYQVTFPDEQTIYGGTLDAINGALTVEWVKVVVDGTNYMIFNYDNNRMIAGVAGFGKGNPKPIQQLIPFNYVKSSTSTIEWNGYINVYGNILVYIPNTITSYQDFGDYVSEHPLEFAYELATPYEIQLDPITVQTLIGNNTIWSDANEDIELDYRADTKLFCQKNDQVNDVQINGTSILDAQGVANVPVADANNLGVVMPNASGGIDINPTTNKLRISNADNSQVRSGTDVYKPITPAIQHSATFYGLAKVAGADMASSSNPVGQFTDEAKSKISDMLNAPVSVSGTTPSITGQAGLRYICGECATLSITAPASGCIDVIFKSGSTPTVLTIASTKVNTTIKWMDDFDPENLDADTTYELNILDGEFGVVAEWT